MISVFDACAMIAFLRMEAGALIVRQILRNNPGLCYAHAMNLCEVYYEFVRSNDVPTAERAVRILIAAGITIREDMDTSFWQAVGQRKAAGRISLADCFCIALAQRLGGEVITSDHHEFDALVPLGIVPIRFIR